MQRILASEFGRSAIQLLFVRRALVQPRSSVMSRSVIANVESALLLLIIRRVSDELFEMDFLYNVDAALVLFETRIRVGALMHTGTLGLRPVVSTPLLAARDGSHSGAEAASIERLPEEMIQRGQRSNHDCHVGLNPSPDPYRHARPSYIICCMVCSYNLFHAQDATYAKADKHVSQWPRSLNCAHIQKANAENAN